MQVKTKQVEDLTFVGNENSNHWFTIDLSQNKYYPLSVILFKAGVETDYSYKILN